MSGFELAGQLTRVQRQMLSLLSQFQLTSDLLASLEGEDANKSLLLVLKIVSNVTSYARTVVSSSGNNSKICRLGKLTKLQRISGLFLLPCIRPDIRFRLPDTYKNGYLANRIYDRIRNGRITLCNPSNNKTFFSRSALAYCISKLHTLNNGGTEEDLLSI